MQVPSAQSALLARIAASNGSHDFPARIGTSAQALASIAERRLAQNGHLLPICQNLQASTHTGTYSGGGSDSFKDVDAKIIAFFLAENTALNVL